MKRESPADDRLERLIDEELRTVVGAPPVDLRAKVLQAIEEERGKRDVQWGFSGVLRPRWSTALAAAAVLVLAALLTWRGGVEPRRGAVTASRPPLASVPMAIAALDEPTIVPAAGVVGEARGRSPRRVLVWDTARTGADALAAASEPYLPGAPAGELGDPVRPLPSPPAISFAPITSAPPVSAFARPVTDFPADNPPPAADSGAAGPSGGTRR